MDEIDHTSQKRQRTKDLIEKRTALIDAFEELVRSGVNAENLLSDLETVAKDLRLESSDQVICVEAKPTTCWGCRENQPNQAAHMDVGGCLFCESDDEDD